MDTHVSREYNLHKEGRHHEVPSLLSHEDLEVDAKIMSHLLSGDGAIPSPSMQHGNQVPFWMSYVSAAYTLMAKTDELKREVSVLRQNVRLHLSRLRARAIADLEAINTDLVTLNAMIGGVYYDAHGFTDYLAAAPGQGGAADTPTAVTLKGFEGILNYLRQAHTSGDDHRSQPFRAKYTVDVMKELHSHIIALVAAVDPDKSKFKSELPNIRTFVLQDQEPVHPASSVVSSTRQTGATSAGAARSIDILETALVNSDITAKCILYGEIDGAQIFGASQPPQSSICQEPNVYGKSVIKGLVDAVAAARSATTGSSA